MSRVHHRHRARILKRDHHKCFICAIKNDLDIHHVVPQCKKGKTEDENLITVCEFCHKMLGKSIPGLIQAKIDSNGSNTIAEYWERHRQMPYIKDR